MAVLTEEQAMLKDAARAWVSERSPVTALRRLSEQAQTLGHDPAVYREIAGMGWAGVVIPEAYGGFAFGRLGLGIIIEELGRTLTATPLVSSALAAADALVLGGSEEQKQAWLPTIASGEAIGVLAIDEGARHAPLQTALAARADGGGWLLKGVKRPVLDGMAADVAMVAARTRGAPGETDGITLFLVDVHADGLVRSPLPQLDRRGAALYRFENVRAGPQDVLGEPHSGAALLDQILDRARAGIAAEMLGAAVQAFETTLEYLKTRVQFGHPIGAFQALQHRAADIYAELAMMRSAVEAALSALDQDAADAPELVSLAKIMACETLKLVSNEMIQMHGGIGMTEEHDAGLYIKRARAAAAAYGGAAFHRERFGRLTGH